MFHQGVNVLGESPEDYTTRRASHGFERPRLPSVAATWPQGANPFKELTYQNKHYPKSSVRTLTDPCLAASLPWGHCSPQHRIECIVPGCHRRFIADQIGPCTQYCVS